MSQNKNQVRAELKEAKLIYYNTDKRNTKGHFVKKVTVQPSQSNGKLQVKNRQSRGFTHNSVEATVVGNIKSV